MMALAFMLMGGLGCAASFWVPHHNRFTQDHAIGAGIVGIIWMAMCFGLALAKG